MTKSPTGEWDPGGRSRGDPARTAIGVALCLALLVAVLSSPIRTRNVTGEANTSSSPNFLLRNYSTCPAPTGELTKQLASAACVACPIGEPCREDDRESSPEPPGRGPASPLPIPSPPRSPDGAVSSPCRAIPPLRC